MMANQGKVVAQEDESGWLLMTPDGVVEHAKNRAIAQRLARSWFRRNLGSAQVGTGRIEWRFLPKLEQAEGRA